MPAPTNKPLPSLGQDSKNSPPPLNYIRPTPPPQPPKTDKK